MTPRNFPTTSFCMSLVHISSSGHALKVWASARATTSRPARRQNARTPRDAKGGVSKPQTWRFRAPLTTLEVWERSGGHSGPPRKPPHEHRSMDSESNSHFFFVAAKGPFLRRGCVPCVPCGRPLRSRMGLSPVSPAPPSAHAHLHALSSTNKHTALPQRGWLAPCPCYEATGHVSICYN